MGSDDTNEEYSVFNLGHRNGTRWIMLRTKRQDVQIRITPSGLIRVGKPTKADATINWEA